jgi:hypothetical protein
MRKRFLIVAKGGRGVPMKEWLRQHPDQIPHGLTPDHNTSHQLRGSLKKCGWAVTETEDEVRIVPPVNAEDVAAGSSQDEPTKGAATVTANTSDRSRYVELVPITLEDLERASASFRQLEKRGSFYDMALALVQAGYQIEGCVLLLATWNFASFRYAATNFDIDGLKAVLNGELQSDFAALTEYDIQSLDLTKCGGRIEWMFNRLASMKEVLYTGATKLMHLNCPKTFVIWDDYIRGGRPRRLYDGLACVASKKWRFHKYDKNGKGYVEFLSDIQRRFRDLRYQAGSKTLAKAIDEFNYVNVTLPIQEIERNKRTKQKQEKTSKDAPAEAGPKPDG